jgi:hypothetical protein
MGHTARSGAFRSHVVRLISFLKSVSGLRADRLQLVNSVLELIEEGSLPTGDWVKFAGKPEVEWDEMEAAMRGNHSRIPSSTRRVV